MKKKTSKHSGAGSAKSKGTCGSGLSYRHAIGGVDAVAPSKSSPESIKNAWDCLVLGHEFVPLTSGYGTNIELEGWICKRCEVDARDIE